MKTTQKTTMNLENLSEGQLKAIALMQFNGEDYFVVNDTVYEGNEDEAKANYNEYNEGLQGADQLSFAEWCNENCSEVPEIDGDEEVNGYMVLTDEEAQKKCEQNIKDSLWAFNASFIIEHSKLPYEAEDMVQSFQADKCESANDTIEALIEDMDEFIEDAISADGRGHFMNTYDGNENEETVYIYGTQDTANPTFYIYRMN